MAYSNLYARFVSWRQSVALAFSLIWRFRPNRLYVISISSLQALAWWQAARVWWLVGENFLVLYYKVNFGIDKVGDPIQVFWLPAYALIITAINLIILSWVSRLESFKPLSHLLLGAASLFALLVNLALVSVYLINFR